MKKMMKNHGNNLKKKKKWIIDGISVKIVSEWYFEIYYSIYLQ